MVRLVISPNERIILHLLEIDKHRDSLEVPIDASQEGMVQRLDIQVHSISRSLASLQIEGIVYDRLAHVRGAPKRRRAYFLTEKGRQMAQNIRSDIAKRRVTLEHSGVVEEMTLEEATRKIFSLMGTAPSLVDITNVARANDTIRTSELPKPAAKEDRERQYVERSHGRPRVDVFFGRDRELKLLEDAVSNRETSVILIWGLPGIGKSTVASKLFNGLSGKHSLFWYTFHEWDSEVSFLTLLAEFLAAIRRNGTSSAMARGAGIAELYQPLADDLAGSDVVVILDDVQKPQKPPTMLLSILSEAARSSASAKLLLVSRAIPDFFSRAAPGNMSLELSGLDRESAWHLASSLHAKDTLKVVEESRGHPLLLSLMSRSGVGASRGDVTSFIEREVYSSLSRDERVALELLCVFRHPVSLDSLPGVENSVVAGLKQKALILEEEEGVWIHDLLREYFQSHMSPDSKQTAHLSAAAYCGRKTGIEWALESLYHSVEGGDWNGAKTVALSDASELGREFPEQTLSLISEIPRNALADADRAEILFMRGQLNEALGSREQAFSDFEESLALLRSDRDSDRRAVVLEAVGRLQSEIERWSESLGVHKKALLLHEKSGDKAGQTREWMSIGGVLRRKGDFRGARDAYSKAMALASMREDRSAQAACLNNMGLLEWDEGNLKEAEARLKESVNLSHTVNDHRGEAEGLENLAFLHGSQMRQTKMTDLLLEAYEAYRRAGELSESKRVRAACADALGDQGRYPEAIQLCESSLRTPELRKRRGLFQRGPVYDYGDVALSSSLVDLYRRSGELKKASHALDRYTDISNSLSDQNLVAKGRLMSAMISEDAGDLESAVRSLAEAESVLRSTGNSEGLIAVHMREGIVEEKLGRYSDAERHYEEAIRHADAAGNKGARAVALENLANVRKEV